MPEAVPVTQIVPMFIPQKFLGENAPLSTAALFVRGARAQNDRPQWPRRLGRPLLATRIINHVRRLWQQLKLRQRFRPLPGRTNIVITRQTDWHAPGALVAHSLEQAMSLCPAPGPLWVIGGAEIYAQALPLASTVVVTEIDVEVQGDAHAPKLGTEWKEMSRLLQQNEDGLSYSFVIYNK